MRAPNWFRRAITLTIALTVGALACSDKHPSDPDSSSTTVAPTPPAGIVVSNPQAASIVAGSVGLFSSASDPSVAYVCARPGTLTDAMTVVVRNETRIGLPRTIPIVSGGFDPVEIEGDVGDKLTLSVHSSSGELRTFTLTIPQRRSPSVVRTNPSKGGVDAALNVQVEVVFSEPIDKSTVTSGSTALLKEGQHVAGQVEVSANGLGVEFVPDNPLELSTEYTIAVSDGIHDLDGDPLAEPALVPFRTREDTPMGQIVFAKIGDGQDGQIYRIGADGSGEVGLTNTGNNLRPVWSPDGSRIAFVKNVPGPANNGFGNGDIYTMAADGSDVKRRIADGVFFSVAWSPDGEKLAISNEGIYYGSIYVISAEDDDKPIALLANDARTPAWSPDGKQIAYVHLSGDDGYHQVYLMNADGTDTRAITDNDGGGIFGLSWSPDGTRLSFAKCNFGSCGLYTMNKDGSGLTQVVAGASDAGSWSPDGKWIAFSIDQYVGRSWKPVIAYVRATGGEIHVLADGAWPSWRR